MKKADLEVSEETKKRIKKWLIISLIANHLRKASPKS